MSRWDGNPCYGDDRRSSSVLPNGLLWNQYLSNAWMLAAYHNTNATSKLIFSASDCWDQPMWNNLNFAKEVGAAALYYRRCIAGGRDVTWTTSSPTFAQFVRSQDHAECDAPTDFVTGFLQNDVNLRGCYMEKVQFPNLARKKYFGMTDSYSGYETSAEDRMWHGGIQWDQRPNNATKWDLFKDFVVKCGEDLMHTQNWRGIGSRYFRYSRNYRSFGLHAAVRCAIFPTMSWGPGYNFTNSQPGSMMPGGPNGMPCYPCPVTVTGT